MRLYHIDAIGVYGTSGVKVIASNERRAKALLEDKYPCYKKYALSVKLLTDDTNDEFVCEEEVW